MILLFLLITLFGCGREHPEPIAARPLEAFELQAEYLTSRLLAKHLDGGYIVSRESDGTPAHQGDALLWSGIALGLLPCEAGRPIFDAIAASAENRGGELVRFEPLPAEYATNPTSRDQLLGLMWGLVRRGNRCPGDGEAIHFLWTTHRDYVESAGSLSLAGDPLRSNLTPAFHFVWRAVGKWLLEGSELDETPLVVEAAILADALRILSFRGPCYPLHLAMLEQLILFETRNTVSKTFKAQFCETTNAASIALIDWYCERDASPVESYLKNFVLNEYEYSHQRCPDWETPDGRASLDTPGLDWLIIYHLAREGLSNGEH